MAWQFPRWRSHFEYQSPKILRFMGNSILHRCPTVELAQFRQVAFSGPKQLIGPLRLFRKIMVTAVSGVLTHDRRTLEEIAGNSDVAAVCEAGWVSPEMMAQIAIVKEKPACIVYGPLSNATETSVPSIVLRLNGKQQMLLDDAWPGIKLEGKPQCHIIAVAKERGEIAISVGCMLSRVRTGLSNNEVTCAIPAEKLQELIERLRVMAAADKAVASYAASDANRFAS